MAGIKDVAGKVAEIINCQKTVAEDAVKAVIEAITAVTDGGESVIIKGFGTFKVKEYAARECTNPQKPGEKILVPAHSKLTFKEGAWVTGPLHKGELMSNLRVARVE